MLLFFYNNVIVCYEKTEDAQKRCLNWANKVSMENSFKIWWLHLICWPWKLIVLLKKLYLFCTTSCKEPMGFFWNKTSVFVIYDRMLWNTQSFCCTYSTSFCFKWNLPVVSFIFSLTYTAVKRTDSRTANCFCLLKQTEINQETWVLHSDIETFP